MTRAILAGAGALPGLIMAAGPAHLVRFAGVPVTATVGGPVIDARFERLGALFADLRAAGVTELCLAGAMTRPDFDPTLLDAETAAVLPRLMAAMAQGDDTVLRTAIALLEEAGFAVVAAHALRPDLVADPGILAGTPPDASDADRARAVLAALGPLDVGQSAVAGRGQVLGIETLQGTDAMLRFVAQTAPGSRGVLVKRPKPEQDLRVDMPAIGPETVRLAAAAGLAGIEIAAGRVLILDRAGVMAACAAAGVALWAVP
jgi:hypothetical protein